MTLDLQTVSCGYGEKVIQKNISFSVHSGEICCLLGPNGVGKTTLFKTMLGFMKRLDGKISLDGQDIAKLPLKKLAKQFGYVPQAQGAPFPYTVEEVVTMGRIAHMGLFSSPSKKDRQIAGQIMETLQIDYLKNQIYTEISGGEKQMALIARALAQQPAFLVMDEPTANLDFGNQIRVLRQIKRLAEQGLGIIMTTHFPDHAFQCRSKVVLLQRGKPFLFGEARDVVTEENLRSAYGVDVKVTEIPVGMRHVCACIPLMEEETSKEDTHVSAL
ncbi:ABC transporter ATP-binding protein [Ethanoligenens sp.]|uniref:ABC transporter ATP-binding protein n=1 Tax=Ethanoligenens sp. TaxID=2099655 RepID=UPI0039E7EC36